MCPTFLTLDSLETKFEFIENEMERGDYSKAKDMEWLKNTGMFFLHEMMHTDLIGKPHSTSTFSTRRYLILPTSRLKGRYKNKSSN